MKESYYVVVIRPEWPGAKQLEFVCTENSRVLHPSKKSAQCLVNSMQAKHRKARYQIATLTFED